MWFCFNSQDYCDHSENCEGCPVIDFDRGGTENPTNGDYIRCMSDKDIATTLLDKFEEICEDGVPSPEWMLHWVKKPVEVGEWLRK